MDFFTVMAGSASVLTDPYVWLLIILGTIFGMVIGAMPGVGQTLAYGLVLPFTFVMAPVPAVAFLLAISVGCAYGNSLPAILIGVPGTPGAVMTAMDGYAMQKAGAGAMALATQYVAAIVGQLISIPMFVLMVVPLSGLAYVFLPPELFCLYLIGMVAIISLAGKSMVKGVAAGLTGLLVGLVGLDPITSLPRYVVVPEIRNGFSVVAVVIGVLAVSELFRQSRQVFQYDMSVVGKVPKFPSFTELRPTFFPILQGTITGTLIGAIPGASGTTAALMAYNTAKIFSKHPELFGEGAIEGIAANEAAQNASNSGELVPTLGLGIPASGSMVLLLAALMVHGMLPGPQMMTQTPGLVYAAVAGMFAATLILMVIGWKCATLMVRVVGIDRQLVIIGSLALIVVGVFSVQSRMVDVLICLLFGVLGYFMLRYGYATAALALAAVIATGFEQTLRRGLSLFDNNIVTFASRPITLFLLVVAGLLLSYGVYAEFKTRKRVAAALRLKESVQPAQAGS